MLHFRKTRPTDIHYAACLSSDVCDLKDYPMCGWFESQAGQWLSFLRCFMFSINPHFSQIDALLPHHYAIPTLSYAIFILIFINYVICRHYIIWNIPIIEANKMYNFSTLFQYTALHVSDRPAVHHLESCYCIHRNSYLSYWNFKTGKITSVYIYIYIYIYIYMCVCVCVCVYVVFKLQNMRWEWNPMLCKNVASYWPLLYEYITMHGPQNVKTWNTPSVIKWIVIL